MQFTSRLLRFLIQQSLVLFNDVLPEIGHPHLPSDHALQVGIELLGLAQIHHIVDGLCGKVVFDPFLSVLFPLDFSLLVAGFQFRLAFEKA